MMKRVKYQDKVFEVFISEAEIKEIVKALAEQINNDYKNESDSEICVVSILSGSFIFVADLVRRLRFDHTIDFVKIRSYEDTSSTGEVEHILELSDSAKDKHIIVVEDIIDTGLTIDAFIEKIKDQNLRSLKTCTLLSKPEVHNDIIPIDYLGKEIPPCFVIGYGLDINGWGRHLKDIYQLVT
jgi:hypoxanthine phosphoribosyltransferase